MAQWRFVGSTDPKKARPFIALSTSPYATNDCCISPADPNDEGSELHVWRSGQDGNVWAPGTINVKWTDLGTVEEVMGG